MSERDRLVKVILAIREGLTSIVEQLNDVLKEMAPETGLPDPAELDKFPWKPYREGHRAAWIFSNLNEAEKLVEMIRHSETGKVEVGEFMYRFSGPKENPMMFISRNPIKPHRAGKGGIYVVCQCLLGAVTAAKR